jgi:hypothetical protein
MRAARGKYKSIAGNESFVGFGKDPTAAPWAFMEMRAGLLVRETRHAGDVLVGDQEDYSEDEDQAYGLDDSLHF